MLLRNDNWPSRVEGNFGFLAIEISNDNPNTYLTGTFYVNEGSSIQDSFTIEKEIKNKKA